MDPDIKRNDRANRRGLVLGLTMAEIMVLVLFALLLAFAAMISENKRLIREYFELKDGVAAALRTDNARDTTQPVLGELNKLVADFVRTRDQNLALQKDNDRLKLAEAKAREENDRLKLAQAKAREAEDVFQELRRSGIQRPESPQGRKELSEKLRIARDAMEMAARSGAEPSSQQVAVMLQLAKAVIDAAKGKPDINAKDPAALAAMLERAAEADQRYRDVLAQNKNYEERLKSLGRGTELPPCWANSETGKPEYLFDVTINSTGMVIKRTNLPHREVQYQKLPISQITLDAELSQSDFRKQTNPLRLYGDQQEQKCRFFVRLYDQTRAQEKEIFKRSMLTTGENFYYWLAH